MTRFPAPPGYSPVTSTLATGRLGVPSVIFFVMSSATPLTAVAGVVTVGYATTGRTGVPLAFLIVGAVLAVFSVGYVAMARQVANAGAFYSYVARALGRPAGVGAAWVALIAYNLLQIGLYGGIGAAAAPLLDEWFGIHPTWWLIAGAAWLLTAVLGVLRVDVNGRILAVLLIAEVTVIVVYSLSDLLYPAGGHTSAQTLTLGNLFGPGVGAVFALVVLCFAGFESAVVFSEESEDPKRTVRLATYLTLVLTAGVYCLGSWAMTVATGPDQIVETSQQQGTEVVFALAAQQLGALAATIGHTLFVTSLIAAMISFHNTTARYAFALGRERVLPAALGRTSRRTMAPRAASLTQSTLALAVITVYAAAGWDPLVKLFYWMGTCGGLGVLFLLLTTSIAIITFFAQHPSGENLWRRIIAPALAALLLLVVVALAVDNLAALLGVPPGHPMTWIVLAGYAAAAVLGAGWGLLLKLERPEVYAAIGMGAKSARLEAGVPGPRIPANTGPVWQDTRR
jgi:amino acid transporter